jgi:hypothetical protein
LKGADPFLAGQHQMDNAEPLAKVDIRVLENGADQDGEPITVRASAARVANPMKGAGMRLDIGMAATRASHKLGPTVFGEVQLAGIFVREHPLEIADGHLMDWLAGLFATGHRVVSPTMGGN